MQSKWSEVELLVKKQKIMGGSSLTLAECHLEQMLVPGSTIHQIAVVDLFQSLPDPVKTLGPVGFDSLLEQNSNGSVSVPGLLKLNVSEHDADFAELGKYTVPDDSESAPISNRLEEIITSKHSIAIVSKLLFYLGKIGPCSALIDSIDDVADMTSLLIKDGFKAPVFVNCSEYARTLLLQLLTVALIRHSDSDPEAQKKVEWVELAFQLFTNTDIFAGTVKFHQNFKFLSCVLSRLAVQLSEMFRWSDALVICRIYMQYMSHVGLEFDFATRILVCELNLDLLLLLRNRDYFEFKTVEFGLNDDVVSPWSYFEEVSMVLSVYEYLLQEYTPFPDANQNPILAEYFYSKVTTIYSMFSSTNENVCEAAVYRYGFENTDFWHLYLESVYRAAKKTFRSKTNLRRLAYTALILESYVEADCAFGAYFERDKKIKSPADWWTLATNNSPSTYLQSAYEFNYDIVSASLAATKTALEISSSHSAISYAEKAISVCKENPTSAGKLLFPIAYCYLGISYDHLSQEIRENEHFYNLQEQAHVMLREAEKYDSENWMIHYSLAIKSTEMGHADIALEHARMILNHNSSNVNAWHLTMLILLSLKQNFSELQVIQRARRVWDNFNYILESGRNSDMDENEKASIIPDGLSHGAIEEYLSFKLTKLLLDEAVIQSSVSDNVLWSEVSKKNEHIVNELMQDYRKTFELYQTCYFPASVDKSEKAPLFANGTEETVTANFGAEVLTLLKNESLPSLHGFYPPVPLNSLKPSTYSEAIHPIRHVKRSRNHKLRFAEIWLQVAQLFRRAQKYEDARASCAEIISIENGSAEAEFELGMISIAEIEQFFIRSTRSMDSLSDMKVGNHKMTKDEMEKFKDAMSHFQAALTFNDEHTLARTWLGRCYMINGNLELARAELERAIKNGRFRGSQLWNTCYQLGVLHSMLNDFEKAKEYFASAAIYEAYASGISRSLEVLPR